MDSRCSFVTSTNLVSAGLTCLKTLVKEWKPRYFITDECRVEEGAIAEAFGGLRVGEQEVSVFFCTLHTNRTFKRKFGKDRLYELMVAAMHAYTSLKAESLVDEAITFAMRYRPNLVDYLKQRKKYMNQWCVYPRYVSCLLLQCLTTNAVEAYHSYIKNHMPIGMGLSGLITYIRRKINANLEKDQDKMEIRKTRALKNTTRESTMIREYPQLKQLPNEMQAMVTAEIQKAREKIESGLGGTGPLCVHSYQCMCKFFVKYNLPCKHMFLYHELKPEPYLTSDIWDDMLCGWEECGFEVYYKREAFYAPADPVVNELSDEFKTTHANIKVMSSMMYDMLNYQGGFEFMESVYPRMIQTLHDFRSNSQMIVTKSRSRKRKKTTSEW